MSDELPAEAGVDTTGILRIRRGPGANCSSIGSVIDLLFGATVLSGLLYTTVATALGDAEQQHDSDRESKASEQQLRPGDQPPSNPQL